jgi:hypothetical protein
MRFVELYELSEGDLSNSYNGTSPNQRAEEGFGGC